MLEERKQKEIEYYDQHADDELRLNLAELRQADFEGFKPLKLDSFQFCYQWLKKNCWEKKLLDYGCGNGIHSIFPAKNGAAVTAIDLSEKSLMIARRRAIAEKVENKTKFLKMDCEALEFNDNSFDIVFDGGTFSSLDLSRALPEIARVLKPEGTLLDIETFGHNPLTNLKRQFNRFVGKRTSWAASHIFNLKDLASLEHYFRQVEVHYFHIVSWLAIPFLNLPGGQILLKSLQWVDQILFKVPFWRYYAFKVVFVAVNPKK